MQASTQTVPDRVFVKWSTPAEEALSTVRLAYALAERRIAAPENISIAVPNRAWAQNVMRAAQSLGHQLVSCIPQHLSSAAEQALAQLEELSNESLQGRSLVHRTGLGRMPEFATGLLHVEGSENAEELAVLLRNQANKPSVPENCARVALALASNVPASTQYLFAIACVNGLVPRAAAFEAESATREQVLSEDREQFRALLATNTQRTFVSYFVKAPAKLAESAGLQVMRYKTENEKRYAMVAPSTFITETRSQRPSTTGGQALLRMYGLN